MDESSLSHTDNREHPLTQGFYTFYEEVLRQKARALRESQGVIAEQREERLNDASDNASHDSPHDNTPNAGAIHDSLITQRTQDLSLDIQRRLRIALESQADTFSNSSTTQSLSKSMMDTARYLMAALADEVFLTLNWCGQGTWKRYLMELNVCQTHVAGEAFFDKLDALLSRTASDIRTNDEGSVLAPLYFLCLSLGFRGRYRGAEHDDVIMKYKARLYQRLHGHAPSLYNAGRKVLSNEPYQNNVSMPYSKGLPDVRRWVMTFAGVLGVYLFVTYVLWYKVVRDVDEAVQFIFDQARYLPL